MFSSTATVMRLYQHFMHDSLRRNSTLLILSQAVNAGSAFLFLVICARLFSTRDVGLATAFISLGGLAAAFTNLGLPNTIIRFLPLSKYKGRIFSASLLAVTLCSILGSAIILIVIKHIAPRLAFVQHDVLLSIVLFLLVTGNTVGSLLDGTLMAFRRGEYILNKALLTNIPRIILPLFVVSYAVKGILSAYVLMLVIGIIFNLYIIWKKLLKADDFTPSFKEVSDHRSFALSNFFGGMLGILPTTLIPIIVLNRLGAVQAAYIYMPMQIAAFLNIIASSTSQALISETSQSDDLAAQKTHILNAAKHLYMMLVPAIILICSIGWPILFIYGKAYASNGYIALLLLASSSIFVAINWLGDTLLNIQKRAAAYFYMNGFNALVVVGAAYALASHGLFGIALGWLIGQLISAVVYLAIFARSQLLSLTLARHTS
jgi:O-antigen/teichoic acid export membrane protein